LVAENRLSAIIQQAEDSIDQVPACYGQVILAQFHMMRYLENPSLLNEITDMVLYRLEESFRCVSNRSDRENLQRQTKYAINNLLFITRAFMLWKIKKNRDEAREILKIAGDSFARAITEIIKEQGVGKKDIFLKLAREITKDPDSKKSLWHRAVDYCLDKLDPQDHEKNFYVTAENVFKKIARRQYLLGKSMLLSETIREYEPYITAIKVKETREGLPNPKRAGYGIKKAGTISLWIGIPMLLFGGPDAGGQIISIGVFFLLFAQTMRWKMRRKVVKECRIVGKKSKCELIALAESIDNDPFPVDKGAHEEQVYCPRIASGNTPTAS
jgi:hypothetical protein